MYVSSVLDNAPLPSDKYPSITLHACEFPRLAPAAAPTTRQRPPTGGITAATMDPIPPIMRQKRHHLFDRCLQRYCIKDQNSKFYQQLVYPVHLNEQLKTLYHS